MEFRKEKTDLLKYSMQVVFLNNLKLCKLILDEEYTKIKIRLMEEYEIVSDWTA